MNHTGWSKWSVWIITLQRAKSMAIPELYINPESNRLLKRTFTPCCVTLITIHLTPLFVVEQKLCAMALFVTESTRWYKEYSIIYISHQHIITYHIKKHVVRWYTEPPQTYQCQDIDRRSYKENKKISCTPVWRTKLVLRWNLQLSTSWMVHS